MLARTSSDEGWQGGSRSKKVKMPLFSILSSSVGLAYFEKMYRRLFRPAAYCIM